MTHPEATEENEFVARFFRRIPRSERSSFTPEQLRAIRAAFGDRAWGEHAVDIRTHFGSRPSYFVLLIGRERRSDERQAFERALRPALTLASAIVLCLFGILAVGTVAGGFYAAKSTLDIDIIPGLDILPDEWIKRLFDQ